MQVRIDHFHSLLDLHLFKYTSHVKDFLEDRQLRFTPFDELNDPFELSPVPIITKEYKNKEKICTDFPVRINEIYKNYGTMCLSRVYNSILMWSHYANNHKGIVIQLNLNKPEFYKNFYKDCSIMANHVSYKRERPLYKLDDEITEDKIKRLFFTKEKQWCYEQETRIVTTDYMQYKYKEKDGLKIYGFFEIPIQCITAIYLGINITEDDRKLVYGFKERNNIEVYQMKKSYLKYALGCDKK